jgi:type II secretory pathway pseudopilin PulG
VNNALIGSATSVVMAILTLAAWVGQTRAQGRARAERLEAQARQRDADLAAARRAGREERGQELSTEVRQLTFERDEARRQRDSCVEELRRAAIRVDSLEDELRRTPRMFRKPADGSQEGP